MDDFTLERRGGQGGVADARDSSFISVSVSHPDFVVDEDTASRVGGLKLREQLQWATDITDSIRRQILEVQDAQDRFEISLATLFSLCCQAYSGDVWRIRGYGSWTQYCRAEFNDGRIFASRGERRKAVAFFHEHALSSGGEGGVFMSNRAIADFLGVSEPTVRRDIAAVATDSSDHDEGDQLRHDDAVGHAESESEQLRHNAAVAQTGEHDDSMSEQLRDKNAVAQAGDPEDSSGTSLTRLPVSSARSVSTPVGGRRSVGRSAERVAADYCRFQYWLGLRGLSQREVARRLGVPQQTVSDTVDRASSALVASWFLRVRDVVLDEPFLSHAQVAGRVGLPVEAVEWLLDDSPAGWMDSTRSGVQDVEYFLVGRIVDWDSVVANWRTRRLGREERTPLSLIDGRTVSQERLAEYCGISQSAVSQIFHTYMSRYLMAHPEEDDRDRPPREPQPARQEAEAPSGGVDSLEEPRVDEAKRAYRDSHDFHLRPGDARPTDEDGVELDVDHVVEEAKCWRGEPCLPVTRYDNAKELAAAMLAGFAALRPESSAHLALDARTITGETGDLMGLISDVVRTLSLEPGILAALDGRRLEAFHDQVRALWRTLAAYADAFHVEGLDGTGLGSPAFASEDEADAYEKRLESEMELKELMGNDF
ncbi:hypothetical protein A200_02880 [Parascardovia denticolens IPLA 20019]|uniref:transcriptional regulator n=1 Tax=Parascardovia denticolens TaxID=78258 RepID=UPI000266A388|nr:transcriptional regulator [Parascardovia denticolens]EIT88516.1 hypothetical protein A200_02880 [Parascardovia denticolens IPLA 20019]